MVCRDKVYAILKSLLVVSEMYKTEEKNRNVFIPKKLVPGSVWVRQFTSRLDVCTWMFKTHELYAFKQVV